MVRGTERRREGEFQEEVGLQTYTLLYIRMTVEERLAVTQSQPA